MKIKWLFIIICILLPSQTVWAKDYTVYVDGEKVLFSAPPVIQNGHTYVLAREIAESIDAEIQWIEGSAVIGIGYSRSYENVKMVSLSKGRGYLNCFKDEYGESGIDMFLYRLSAYYHLDHKVFQFEDESFLIINNKAYIPLYFVADAFNYELEYFTNGVKLLPPKETTWQEEFGIILHSYLSGYQENQSSSYPNFYIFDVDGNGIPELVIEYGIFTPGPRFFEFDPINKRVTTINIFYDGELYDGFYTTENGGGGFRTYFPRFDEYYYYSMTGGPASVFGYPYNKTLLDTRPNNETDVKVIKRELNSEAAIKEAIAEATAAY